MKSISLLLRVLAIVGAIVAVVGWVATQDKVKDANADLTKAKSQAKAAQVEAADFDKKFQAAQSKAGSLESDLADAKSRVQSGRAELSVSKRETTAARAELKESKAELKSLEAQNTKLKEEIIAARTEVPDVDPEQIKAYEEKIATLGEEVDNLKDRLARSSTGSSNVIAATDGVSATTGTGGAAASDASATPVLRLSSSGQTASVLKADVDNGLIVISRGQKQGLQKEMEFGIAKGFSAPVRVKVARTAPDYSVAYILPGGDPSFAAGDEVTLVQ